MCPSRREENPAGVRLLAAINASDVKAARQAIADGASLEHAPDLLRSPLAIAFDEGYTGDWRGVAKVLVEAGAPIDGYDWEESLICTPIQSMGKNEEGGIERMQVMLALGASVNSRGRVPLEGSTPLHFAVERTLPQVVQFLIDEGADLDARDAYGRTPLELAEHLASDDLDDAGANDEASSTEEDSSKLTSHEFLARQARERAKRRIQIVKLLREFLPRRKGGSLGRLGKVKR